MARTLAAELGAKLAAFETVDFPYYVFAGPVITSRNDIERMVHEAREKIAALGGVDAHAAYGDPAEELALWGASQDLLIVGSRGYGPTGRLVHAAHHTRSPTRRVVRGLCCRAARVRADAGHRRCRQAGRHAGVTFLGDLA